MASLLDPPTDTDTTDYTNPVSAALGDLYRKVTGYMNGKPEMAFRYANNPIGTETTRPEQTVSMPDPSFRPGVMLPGGTAPVSRETIDAFRAGSEDLYNQASLLGGSRGVFEPPGGVGGAVTLASRRPLANPPPSTRGLLGVPAPPSEPPPPFFINYHGSPHEFPPTARNPLGEFDPAKIGTGEGNQAFGVGAGYTADAEGVARGYRDAISKMRNPMTIAPEFRAALNAEDNLGFDTSGQAVAAMRSHPDWPTRWDVEKPDALAALFDAHEAVRAASKGHMYEVKINADPEHFLDWDKPLSEQHPKVQAALTPEAIGLTAFGPVGPKGYYGWADETGKRIGPSLRTGSPGPLFDPKATGQDIYRTLHDNPTAAAEMLHKAGIPGIRYLDAGSRGAGEGSRNTVVFDPTSMEVIRRYGVAGLLGGAAAAGSRVGADGRQEQ